MKTIFAYITKIFSRSKDYVAISIDKDEASVKPSEKTWYLRDEPLERLGEEDKLRHQIYVRVLLNVIKGISPPFTLGLFGGWGIGKTSIVKEFCKSMQEDEELSLFPTAYIDVWKYEKDSLRRQFLIDIQRQLKRAKNPLSKNHDVESLLYRDLTTHIQKWHFSFRQLIKAIMQFIVVSIVVMSILVFIPELFSRLPTPLLPLWQNAIIAVTLGLLYQVFKVLLRTVTIQKTISSTEPALFSAEQFEEAFGNMVKVTPCKGMVIIIDNLDRCCSDRVVEVLGVLKTYLEPVGEKKCVFIIPCDDEAIKEHVKAAYEIFIEDKNEDKNKEASTEYADEYIRKFFNASIRITPFIEKEIEPYIESQLEKMRLIYEMPKPEEGIKRLTQMVASVFRKNPRQIKQFLNNVTSKYLLVKEREADPDPMIKPQISDNVLFLAKVTVIETKFERWFKNFVADDNMYGETIRDLYSPEMKRKIGEGLWHFLDRTRDITADNYKAFFHLKQNPHERNIPNYYQFLYALRDGEQESIKALFEAGDDTANRARFDEIRLQVQGNARNGHFDYVIRIISVGCAVASRLSPDEQKQFANETIATIAKYPEVQNRLDYPLLLPSEVFALMPSALKGDSNRVKAKYLSLYSQKPEKVSDNEYKNLRREIAKAIASNIETLSKTELNDVRDVTTGFDPIDPGLLSIVSSKDESRAAFVTAGLVKKAIETIKEEDVISFAGTDKVSEEHEPLVKFVICCQDSAEADAATLWVQKLAAVLEPNLNKNQILEDYMRRCIDESLELFGKAENSSVDKIANLLNQSYQNANNEQRLLITLTLQGMFDYCSVEKEPIKSRVINEFTGTEPFKNVIKFIVIQASKDFNSLPYSEEVLGKLAQRVVSQDGEEFRTLIRTDLLDPEGANRTALLARLLTAVIKRPEISVTIPLVEGFKGDFPKWTYGKSLAAPILNEAINPSRSPIPILERGELLRFTVRMKDWHTNDYRKKFEAIMINMLNSNDQAERQLGIDITSQAFKDSVISRESYSNILRNLAASLIERKPAPDESIMQQLDLIINNEKDVITPKIISEFIEYLRELIRPDKGPAFRQKTLSLLLSLSGLLGNILKDLVPELVGYAETESDPTVKTALEESLISLRRDNSPAVVLDRNIWNRLYQYVKDMKKHPDEAMRRRGNQLNGRMGQITANAKKI